MRKDKVVVANVEINAPTSRVWWAITDPKCARILGYEFDQDAYVESDWKLGAKVYFRYAHAPEKAINTGVISKLIEEALIQVDYRFFLFWKYAETYSLTRESDSTILQIEAGPYSSDLEGQKVAWKNWLAKVQELSEAE